MSRPFKEVETKRLQDIVRLSKSIKNSETTWSHKEAWQVVGFALQVRDER